MEGDWEGLRFFLRTFRRRWRLPLVALWQADERKLYYNGLSFYKAELVAHLEKGDLTGKGDTEIVISRGQQEVVVRREGGRGNFFFLWGKGSLVVPEVEIARAKRMINRCLDVTAGLSSFVAQFPLGLVVASLEEGRILSWSPRLETMTGWSEKEVRGKLLSETFLFSVEESEEVRQNLLFGETLFLRNVKMINRFSEERLLNFHFFPWKFGKTVFMVALVEDVTERARWGESIRQMERLSSIGRFISSVAHEINNPLAVIYGYTQMLLPRLEKGISECEVCRTTKKALEKIEKEAEHCGALIKYLVDFSRPMVLQKERVNINTLVEESLALVDFYVDEQKRVELSLAENLPPVLVDSTRLKQVFINLIKNAFEAMEERGGTLSVTTRLRFRTSGLVSLGERKGEREHFPFIEITFADTGKGIPREKLPRIFEPFFTTKAQGAGLGLSICYGIVRAHRGFIEVDSTEGKGTQFRVFLPVEDDSHDQASA